MGRHSQWLPNVACAHSDCLPPQVSRREQYERILELERKLETRPSLLRLSATYR
jgi:hypothetical protein